MSHGDLKNLCANTRILLLATHSLMMYDRDKDQLTIGGAKTERQKREDRKIPNSSWERENYHLYLVERNWKRFKRQCFFFLVQWWKTYQLFSNSFNRCGIRMGILHKNSSRSFSWRTALRLSYSSQLQWHCFDRRINLGTAWLLCEKIQEWYLKNRLTNHQHPMAWQENHSRESFRRIVREGHLRL